MANILLSPLIFLLIANSSWAQAIYGRSCLKVFQPDFPAETSIELELELSPQIAHILTSPDGHILSLFQSKDDIPDRVRELVQKEGLDLFKTLLDNIKPNVRAEIFRQSIISRKMTFQQSANEGRVIPALLVKPEFQTRFNLRAKVDLGSPETVRDGRLIEIHLRSRKESGDLMLDSSEFLKFLGLKPQPLHMHVVTKIPDQWLKQDKSQFQEVRSFQMIEHWRRMNLFFEMRDVVEKGVGIINNSAGDYMNFAPLQFSELSAGFEYLRNLNPAHPKSLGAEAKMAWVGFWGSDKYDGQSLMGYEFRFLTGVDQTPEMQSFLNQFPFQLQQRRFGNSPELLQRWFAIAHSQQARTSEGAPLWEQLKFISSSLRSLTQLPHWLYSWLSPHQKPEALLTSAAPEIQYVLSGLDHGKLNSDLESRGRLRYLLHDWSKDPILFDQPELIENIRQKQIRAVRKWARGENETQVVQEFLIDSGLLFHFGQSVGYKL